MIHITKITCTNKDCNYQAKILGNQEITESINCPICNYQINIESKKYPNSIDLNHIIKKNNQSTSYY